MTYNLLIFAWLDWILHANKYDKNDFMIIVLEKYSCSFSPTSNFGIHIPEGLQNNTSNMIYYYISII